MFAISNHSALILSVHTLRSCLNLICEYELHSLPNKKLVAQRIMVKLHQDQTAPGSPSFAKSSVIKPSQILTCCHESARFSSVACSEMDLQSKGLKELLRLIAVGASYSK